MYKTILYVMIACSFSAGVYAENPIQYRVLIQVSEDSVDRLNQALSNAANLLTDFGYNNVEIEIIALGAGVNTLRGIAPFPVADKVKELHRLGVRILADEEAMKKARLTATDMLTQVRYIPSGLVELIEKQALGWAYIRP
ncbi:MAG: hypothetical protein GY862_29975 [Gammaproteobacteria bacterium]|nr:hypothetical protein [Gammaproteobacteria bacterium]